MTPLVELAKLYVAHPLPRSLWEDLEFFDTHGCVFGGEDFLVMGRAVYVGSSIEDILNPRYRFIAADAWFIYAFVGNVNRIIEVCPYKLPWVGWARANGTIRWYKAQRALQLVSRMISFGITSRCHDRPDERVWRCTQGTQTAQDPQSQTNRHPPATARSQVRDAQGGHCR